VYLTIRAFQRFSKLVSISMILLYPASLSGCASDINIGEGVSYGTNPFPFLGERAGISLPELEVTPGSPATYSFSLTRINPEFRWSLFLNARQDFRFDVNVKVLTKESGRVLHTGSRLNHYSGYIPVDTPEGAVQDLWAAGEAVELVIRLEVTHIAESEQNRSPLRVFAAFRGM
jgi:hypothetical protein